MMSDPFDMSDHSLYEEKGLLPFFADEKEVLFTTEEYEKFPLYVKPEYQEVTMPATGHDSGLPRIWAIILALTLSTYFWTMFTLINLPSPTYLLQPRVHLNPALAYKVTLFSTAEEFTDLQDQLSARMTRHNAVMSTNLANFASVLSAVTADADLALEHVQFVNKVISLGAGRTADDWQGDADIVIKEAENLRDIAISSDLHTMLENITQIARTMTAEMTDMELFMQDANSAANILLNRLGNTVYNLSAPTNEMNATIAQAVGDQKIQWSWDEINEDGITRRSIGEFSHEQQILLKSFFHNMTHHGISTVVIPSVVRYGLGLPDTFPQALRSFGLRNLKTAIERVSLLGLGGELYTCEIVAHFGTVWAPRDAYVNFGLNYLFSFGIWPYLLPKSQFLGLQSMICGYDGEEWKDVVRQRG